ncbi:MAG: hypothetical protein BWY71_00916 [Planctomycetes bacterium ADurb.Bin412]|nr:MAG: hypothetical protein BWY71_00916 [Planctomycetes bacterium ADurb.Bin412]
MFVTRLSHTRALRSGSAKVSPLRMLSCTLAIARRYISLPVVSLVMFRASRIGTPAEIRVPSVRVKRAIEVLDRICPSTGIFKETVSSTKRPVSLMRIKRSRKTRATGIPSSTAQPHCSLIHFDTASRILVGAGKSVSKSAKIFWNLGITKYIIPITIAKAIKSTQIG